MSNYLKFIFILIISVNLYCSKDDSPVSSSNIIKDNGILSWTGDYAVDGCGFFITISNHKYKPENEWIIDASYKKSYDINVLIEYEILNRQMASSCGDLPYATLTDGIKIISIEKE